MEETVYNPQKGRLETIHVDYSKENTTWFDDYEDSEDIYMITDYKGGILIKEVMIRKRQRKSEPIMYRAGQKRQEDKKN